MGWNGLRGVNVLQGWNASSHRRCGVHTASGNIKRMLGAVGGNVEDEVVNYCNDCFMKGRGE
jgi:hypothetical protein